MGALSLARLGAAQEAVPRAAIDGDIVSYYDGEALSAYVILGFSVAYLGAGVPLVTLNSDFARGLGVPLLSLGVLEGIGGILYAVQTHAELVHYRAVLANDPEGFRKEELTHIEGTRSRFIYYRSVELALTLAGLGFGTYGFIANQDLYKGLGIGLFAIGLPFLIIDTINNSRLGRYYSRLQRFDPKLALQKDASGWRLALGAKF
jgi:hypothetical protein